MKELTNIVNDYLTPIKALLFYKGKKDESYIECYDMDNRGMAINAHPLSIAESQKLADALDSSAELKAQYLNSVDLFPENLLYLDAGRDGHIVWHTPKQEVDLFFKAELGLSNGKANIPALIWKASRYGLAVWAVKCKGRPSAEEKLFQAPFLNVYDSGSVCMGSVQIDVPKNCTIKSFCALWEHYFFNSSFSHTIAGSERLVSLWQSLLGTGKPFPMVALKKTDRQLKHILR
ncbi:MAG: hypothetical protein REI78_03005 [Pedobacter sp.]|nr:hypothetical protein [Pedobacter sp.]